MAATVQLHKIYPVYIIGNCVLPVQVNTVKLLERIGSTFLVNLRIFIFAGALYVVLMSLKVHGNSTGARTQWHPPNSTFTISIALLCYLYFIMSCVTSIVL